MDDTAKMSYIMDLFKDKTVEVMKEAERLNVRSGVAISVSAGEYVHTFFAGHMDLQLQSVTAALAQAIRTADFSKEEIMEVLSEAVDLIGQKQKMTWTVS